ncbi:hypothetical protein [Cupriavidus basilensis]|uniref:Uncharacterized protein n=1 Tax=Cupriavidus basilensis TaxID=68895 RepID=A0A643FWT6_9BURK|nr:hypothetical protein [Cupriavidus basilensis]QOT78824.1 hypothetical protein F7R26_028935 [Cupriavidus basilensis]
MYRSHRLFGALLLSMFSLTATARDSLCTKDEQVAFSCTVKGNKLVSLCASPDLSKTKGYVQYRFGKKGAVELAYPKLTDDPRKHFRWGVTAYSGGGTDYFRFSNGGYDYVVYAGSGKGWEKEGLVVEKDQKRIASLPCRDGGLGPDNWAVMYSAGLPELDQGKPAEQFDMP